MYKTSDQISTNRVIQVESDNNLPPGLKQTNWREQVLACSLFQISYLFWTDFPQNQVLFGEKFYKLLKHFHSNESKLDTLIKKYKNAKEFQII